MTCLLATNNPAKVQEIKAMFEAEGLSVICLSDLSLSLTPDETGATFEENAGIKAAETAAFLRENGHGNIVVLADDSGLQIDALDGRPGVDSALFMGRETPYAVKNRRILDMMAGVPEEKRTARFVCVLVCVGLTPEPIIVEGRIEGRIAYSASGTDGFGYDPIFFYPAYNKTLAELTPEEKNLVSHRGQALQKMMGVITNANISN